MPMNYRVTLFESDEGWAVSCPDLPGCHSQGANREEALENIREAIRLWLEVEAEETGLKRFEQAEVTIDKNARIKLVKDIQTALLDKYTPMIYLENPTIFIARYKYVRDYQYNPATVTMYRLEAWLDK